jgi:hypothetical protein
MEKLEGMAHCGQCKTYKPNEEFAPSQRHNGGWCRACHKAKYRQIRPALPSIECETCGGIIEEPLHDQRFCSAACKMKARYWRLSPRQEKSCGTCGADITHMRRDAEYCSSACMQKAKARRLTPRQRRELDLWSNYGITHDQYDAMLVAQDGGCAICGNGGEQSRFGVLHVDHDHETGRVRGLLCDSCNLSIGKFRDNPAMLRRAADYIERGSFAPAPLLASINP